ncbi:hypothetical protein TNIN_344311, partial [Trichonephila inaurata madagascariensis]
MDLFVPRAPPNRVLIMISSNSKLLWWGFLGMEDWIPAKVSSTSPGQSLKLLGLLPLGYL